MTSSRVSEKLLRDAPPQAPCQVAHVAVRGLQLTPEVSHVILQNIVLSSPGSYKLVIKNAPQPILRNKQCN